jgi:DNA-binding response OmpR family regulator
MEKEEKQEKTKKILLAQSEASFSYILRKKFEKEGFFVEEAKDGISVLKLLRENKYDLLILDIILLKMPGLEVIKSINNNPQKYNICPIIIISDLGQEEDINKAKCLGIKHYFVKSEITPEKIVSQIKSLLNENGLENKSI